MVYDLHRRGRNNRLENDLMMGQIRSVLENEVSIITDDDVPSTATVLQSKEVCIVISEPEEQK